MKKIKYILVSALLCAALGLSGCYDKDVTLSKLPDMAITNLPTTVSAYIGQIRTFEPIAMIGGQESEFTYKWYRMVTVEVEDDEGNITEEDALEEIQEERVLELRMEDLGGYYLWLEATHTETGLTASHVLNVSIETRIAHGWLILKETSAGDTEMDAAVTLSDQSVDKSYDMLAASTGREMDGKPVAVYYQNWFAYDDGGTWDPWQSVHNCVTIVSAREAMVWNTRTESQIAGMDDLFFVAPDGDRNFEAFAVANGPTGYPPSRVSNSSVSPLIDNGKALYMFMPTGPGWRPGMETQLNGAIRFFPEIEGDYHLAPQLVQGVYGYTVSFFMAYDETSSSFVRFWKSYSDVGITKFPNDGGVAPCNDMNSTLIYMGQTRGTFDDAVTDEGNYAGYALMKENGAGGALVLYGLNLIEATTARTLATIKNPIKFKRELSNVPAAFATADHYTLHQTQKWLYYTKGNSIGYYDIENDLFHDNIYNVPGSEVTYINYIQNDYDAELDWSGSLIGADYRFDNLVVASTDGSNYTVSIFNVGNNGSLSPLSDKTLTGTGKVKMMIWLGGSVSENQYKYNN